MKLGIGLVIAGTIGVVSNVVQMVYVTAGLIELHIGAFIFSAVFFTTLIIWGIRRISKARAGIPLRWYQ